MSTSPPAVADRSVPSGAAAYSLLLDLVALLIVVQAGLAGVFLQHDGRRARYDSWVGAHGMVGYMSVVLTVAAAVLAVARLRSRRDLVAGTAALAVLLVVESSLGTAIGGGHAGLTVVHVPLALALMGLTTWLVVRGIALRRGNA